MIFIIGSAYQGKYDFVVNSLKIQKENIFNNLQEKIRELLNNGEDVQAFLNTLVIDNSIKAIICDEVGSGVVPIDKKDREWREKTGRASCFVAKNAKSVYRIHLGIPIKIKG